MAKDLVIELKAQNKELKQKLQESKRELNEFKRAVKEANSATSGAGKSGGSLNSILKSLGLNAGKAGGSINLLGGGLTKLAGYLGLAMGAAELFNSTIQSSNELGDQMERIQTQAGAAVNYFSSCLANVDFSNFWTGMTNAIAQAGELADKLDAINSELRGLGARNSRRDLRIAELEGEAAGLSRSDPKRKEIYDKIAKIQEEKRKDSEAVAQAQYNAAIQKVAVGAGLSKSETALYSKDIVDLIENTPSEKLVEAAEAYKKLKDARNAKANATFNTTGSGGGFNYQDVNRYTKEIQEAESAVKKLGLTQRQAQIMQRLVDTSDNGSESILSDATRDYQNSFGILTNIQREKNALTMKETMLNEKLAKKAAAAGKAAEALAKKTYTANAKTEFQLKANITALTELREKEEPLSDTWKIYNDEIEETQKKLAKIDIDKLADNSFAKMQGELKALNEELANTAINSSKFIEVRNNIKSVEKAITEANYKTIDWSDNSEAGLLKAQAALLALKGTLEPDMTDAIKAIYDQLFGIEKELKKFDRPVLEGSIEEIDKQIQELSQEYTRTSNSSRRIKLKAEISELEYKKGLKENEGANPKLSYTPTQQQAKSTSDYQTANASASAVVQNFQIGVIGYEDAKLKLAEINNELKRLGLEPIEIRIVSKGVQKTAKALNIVGDTLEGVSDAFSALGAVAEDPALDVAGIIAGAIANIMMGYATASVAAAQSGNPWVWIAFAIAGLATAMAAAASIKSATGGFAEGGIVGGASPIGDRLYARVNSGEMILNGSQQANLFKAIDDGRLGGEAGVGEVSFVLRGSDLYGSLKNYGLMKARAGKTIKIG